MRVKSVIEGLIYGALLMLGLVVAVASYSIPPATALVTAAPTTTLNLAPASTVTLVPSSTPTSSPTPTLAPSPTPTATATPVPSPTPTSSPTPTLAPSPTPTAARSWAESNCLHWSQAGGYVGSHRCIYGQVRSIYDAGDSFFVAFTDNQAAFYVVSFDYALVNVQHPCLAFGGVIETYQGRPEIILRNPRQVFTCDGYQVPLCFNTPGEACIDLLNATPLE